MTLRILKHDRPTPRELEVLYLMAAGYPNSVIAKKLVCSEHTVKFHCTSLFCRLNARSRTGAVINGLRRGHLDLKKIPEVDDAPSPFDDAIQPFKRGV